MVGGVGAVLEEGDGEATVADGDAHGVEGDVEALEAVHDGLALACQELELDGVVGHDGAGVAVLDLLLDAGEGAAAGAEHEAEDGAGPHENKPADDAAEARDGGDLLDGPLGAHGLALAGEAHGDEAC